TSGSTPSRRRSSRRPTEASTPAWRSRSCWTHDPRRAEPGGDRGGRDPARRAGAARRAEAPRRRLLHQRSLDERVPALASGRLRAGHPGDGLERLPRRLAADAVGLVVGVRLERKRLDVTSDLVEFAAFGTAVRSTRYALGDETVLSNLSGQDFAKLFVHGYWPVGFVADTSVTYVVAGYASRQAKQGLLARTAQGGPAFMQNMELTDYTQGFYEARANAMRRLE